MVDKNEPLYIDSNSKDLNNSFEVALRSEELQEVLSKMPHWIIRWGSLIMLMLVLLTLLFTYLIKYPDVYSAPIIIKATFSKEKLSCKNSGIIESIFFRNNDYVRAKTPIAVIYNSANYKDVFLLKNITDTFNLKNNNFPFQYFKRSQLGEIENAFYEFKQKYSNYINYKIEVIDKDVRNDDLVEKLQSQLIFIEHKKKMYENKIRELKKQHDGTRALISSNVNLKKDYEIERLVLIQLQKKYQELRLSISDLHIVISELRENTKPFTYKDYISSRYNANNALLILKTTINKWYKNYVLSTSIDGEILYNKNLSVGQVINQEDSAFTIIPINNEYSGKITVNSIDYTKFRIGQSVIIKILYPQNTIIKSQIKSIIFNNKNKISLYVELPNFVENECKDNHFICQEIMANADIIINEKRLIERILP